MLGVDAKDLQNLVQFNVLQPPRRDRLYWFDNRLLLEAKVADERRGASGLTGLFVAGVGPRQHVSQFQ